MLRKELNGEVCVVQQLLFRSWQGDILRAARLETRAARFPKLIQYFTYIAMIQFMIISKVSAKVYIVKIEVHKSEDIGSDKVEVIRKVVIAEETTIS